jgi:hypothetical protein
MLHVISSIRHLLCILSHDGSVTIDKFWIDE